MKQTIALVASLVLMFSATVASAYSRPHVEWASLFSDSDVVLIGMVSEIKLLSVPKNQYGSSPERMGLTVSVMEHQIGEAPNVKEISVLLVAKPTEVVGIGRHALFLLKNKGSYFELTDSDFGVLPLRAWSCNPDGLGFRPVFGLEIPNGLHPWLVSIPKNLLVQSNGCPVKSGGLSVENDWFFIGLSNYESWIRNSWGQSKVPE